MSVRAFIINSCILTVFTHHTTRPFQMNRSVVFSIFAQFCNNFRVSFFFLSTRKEMLHP